MDTRANNTELYNFQFKNINPADEMYTSDKFIQMIQEISLVKVESHPDTNRAHCIWVGSEFPPDVSKYPKTQGFDDNVASLRKMNPDYNHILWIDKNDFSKLSAEKQQKTKDYCTQHGIALICIQDVFPKNDPLEMALFNVYAIEHFEGNFSACSDALRVMLLRRFHGLYFDVDNKVINKFENDTFSKTLLQFHYIEGSDFDGGGVNGDLVWAPFNSNEDIDAVAHSLILAHQLKFRSASFFYSASAAFSGSRYYIKEKYNQAGNYLMIPYHYIRAGRAISGTGPGAFTEAFKEQITDVSKLKYDSENKTCKINLDYFNSKCASTWLEKTGPICFNKVDSIPEYKFNLQDHFEDGLFQLLLYYHYLEERTLRFDFFHIQIEEIFLRDHINIEKNIFNNLINTTNNFTTVEYIAFNLVDTFSHHYKSLLDQKMFPNLRLELYIPEFLFLIKKGDLNFEDLLQLINARSDNKSDNIVFFINTLMQLNEGKTIKKLISNDSSVELTLLQKQCKNKVPQTTFFSKPFNILAETYRLESDVSKARKDLLNFIQGDQCQFIKHLALINNPRFKEYLFGAGENSEPNKLAYQFLNKVLRDNDEELLNALVKNNVYVQIDDVALALDRINKYASNDSAKYLFKLLIDTPNLLDKANKQGKLIDTINLLLNDPEKTIAAQPYQNIGLAIFDFAVKNSVNQLIGQLGGYLDTESLDKIATRFIEDSFSLLSDESKVKIIHLLLGADYRFSNSQNPILDNHMAAKIFVHIAEKGTPQMMLAAIWSNHPIINSSAACAYAIRAKNNPVFETIYNKINMTRDSLALLWSSLYADNAEACLFLLRKDINLFDCDIQDEKKHRRPDAPSILTKFLFVVTDVAKSYMLASSSMSFKTAFHEASKCTRDLNFSETDLILFQIPYLLKATKSSTEQYNKMKTFCSELAPNLTKEKRDVLTAMLQLRERIDQLNSIFFKNSVQTDLYNRLSAFINDSKNFVDIVNSPIQMASTITSMLQNQGPLLDNTSFKNLFRS